MYLIYSIQTLHQIYFPKISENIYKSNSFEIGIVLSMNNVGGLFLMIIFNKIKERLNLI